MRRKIGKTKKRGAVVATGILVGVLALSRVLHPVQAMLPPTYRIVFGLGVIMFFLAAAPLLLLWLTSKDDDA